MNEPSPPLRLVLSEEQTATVRGAGVHFVAGSPLSFNTGTGRATVFLIPCDKKTADAAVSVAQGTHRAVKINKATTQP